VKRIAIGLAGYGKIARDQHEPAITASDDFELVAVADPTANHATLPSYSSLAAMLEARPEIAAVSLCMPPRFRARTAAEAITAGRHVLLEKPPCETLAEAENLLGIAQLRGTSLYTAWHSQHAAGVDAAHEWLAGRTIRSVQVTWKEDVRVWHPGQRWIWQKGGFGVFDPGINALSILSAILPGALHLAEAELEIPVDCVTPIAARLQLAGEGFPVSAELDFRQTGPQSWDIAVETDAGPLLLSQGGNALFIDGERQNVGEEAEYRSLYARFAALVRTNRSETDLDPFRLVVEALEKGRVIRVEAFGEHA
jgi:D-galactose 1-dehydrogenase